MPLLTTDQVNICADFVVRAGLVGDTPSRQAVLVRIGEEPANHQSDGVTAAVFATLLVNDLSQREDRETIGRLLDVLSEVLPREEGIRSLQRSVGVLRGLLALGELLSNPRVRDAAGEFRATFAATRARIGPVVTYKLVHDQLHDLEFNCHNRARNNLERFRDPEDDFATREMENCRDQLEIIAGKLRDLAVPPVFLVPPSWIAELETLSVSLKAAIDARDIDGIQKMLARTGRILDRRPSEINSFLVEAARQLRLEDLVIAFRSLYARLLDLGIDPARAAELKHGVDQMDALDRRLKQLISVHTTWQEIDIEIRPIEALLADRIAAGDFSWWENLKDLTRHLDANAPVAFLELQIRVDGAIEQRKAREIADSFRKVQREIKVGFRDADKALRRHCVDLPDVLKPVMELLG